MTEPPRVTLRVHKAPEVLLRPPADLDLDAKSRFDDPWGYYGVRYTASNLRGCLVETIARFRPAPATENILAAVDGIEDSDVDPTRDDGLIEWLAAQRVGTCTLHVDEPQIVDVDVAEALVALDKHPDVRDALQRSGLGTVSNPVRLDGAIIRLAGRVGRPITQAVSRAVVDWFPDVHGLAYASRIDEREQCWAYFERTPVSVTSVPLSTANPEHRATVQSVAALFEIVLPDPWA